MKVSAVYMDSVLGNVEENMMIAEKYVKESAEKGAKLVALPEFFTTGFAINPELVASIAPSSKALIQMKKWASTYGIAIGGSYLEFDVQKQEVYNTYSLVLSTGEVYNHRKDIPTAAESFCYAPGDEVSCFDTPIGRVGIAMCWEMLRYQTVRRILGKVDFVIAGSCWWNFCEEDGPMVYDQLSRYNEQLALEAPKTLAKLLGVPVIHATHKASFKGASLFDQTKLCERPIVGVAQIVSGDGEILKIIQKDRPAGIILDEIEIAQGRSDYWIPAMPPQLVQGFEMLNETYSKIYKNQILPSIKSKVTN